jgi:HD superfamily phosphohydrolase
LKFVHEFRDPIHTFVRITSSERAVLDSPPLQRLRSIHQLAMSYRVYPGATHRRFEHSLGVMETATRIFDRIITTERERSFTGGALEGIHDDATVGYWKNVLRMASLCHDIGHLPFSHAAEDELLPIEGGHEAVTRRLIEREPIAELLGSLKPPLDVGDVVYVALGPKRMGTEPGSPWVRLLAEVLTGDEFGADRIDYLLRDAYHAGVAYGRFDHYRLIDTLRVLPRVLDEGELGEPSLGIEDGGIQSAEALALARYFMFAQVYMHPVRRIYDIHLKEFLKAWLPGGTFSGDPDDHLRITDDEVLTAIRDAAAKPSAAGHEAARRIIKRDHFRLLDEPDSEEDAGVVSPGELVYAALQTEFGSEFFRYDFVPPKASRLPDFSVLRRDDSIVRADSRSKVLTQVPAVTVEYVFVAPEKRHKAREWLSANKPDILAAARKDAEIPDGSPGAA